LFVTRIWDAALADAGLLEALDESCTALARDDVAGRRWSREQGYGGYTSYASLDDLPVRDPAFGDLKRWLDRQVAAYAKASFMELGKKLKLDSMWVNVLAPGAGHSGHVHPHSVVSGTLYVVLPEGASGLRLEDPRLPMMMAAPGRTDDAPEDAKTFVYLTPAVGTVYLWESWLRHEVPVWTGPKASGTRRISISFNYS
jgi:uncharacterized protein (TIGR02466 family)